MTDGDLLFVLLLFWPFWLLAEVTILMLDDALHVLIPTPGKLLSRWLVTHRRVGKYTRRVKPGEFEHSHCPACGRRLLLDVSYNATRYDSRTGQPLSTHATGKLRCPVYYHSSAKAEVDLPDMPLYRRKRKRRPRSMPAWLRRNPWGWLTRLVAIALWGIFAGWASRGFLLFTGIVVPGGLLLDFLFLRKKPPPIPVPDEPSLGWPKPEDVLLGYTATHAEKRDWWEDNPPAYSGYMQGMPYSYGTSGPYSHGTGPWPTRPKPFVSELTGEAYATYAEYLAGVDAHVEEEDDAST